MTEKLVVPDIGDFEDVEVIEILTKAGVYVRKTPAAKSSGGSTGGGRVSVADAQDSLTSALSDAGQEVDSAIISKLTGKAAVYFKGIVEALNN